MTRYFLLLLLSLFANTNIYASILEDPLNSMSAISVVKEGNCVNNQLQKIDLVGAIDIALCNNLQTKIAWQNAKYFASEFGQAKSQNLPKVSFGATAQNIYDNGVSATAAVKNHYNSYVPSINLSYLLYDFGGRKANIASSEAEALASAWDYNDVVQTLILQVITSYISILIDQEYIKAAKNAESSSKEILNAARVKLKVGVVTPADQAQAQTSYSQSILNRKQAENTLYIEQGNFANLLHLSPDTQIDLANINYQSFSQPLSLKIKDLIDIAIKQRPDLEAIKARQRQAMADFNQAKAKNYPSISAVSSLSRNYYDGSNKFHRFNNIIGLELTIPIFTGFSNKYQIQAARYNLELVSTRLLQSEDNIALDVWTSYQNYQTAKSSYDTAKTLLTSAKMSADITFARYKLGTGNLLDALTAKAQLAEASFIEVQARGNLLITKFNLDRALGSSDIRLEAQKAVIGEAKLDKKPIVRNL